MTRLKFLHVTAAGMLIAASSALLAAGDTPATQGAGPQPTEDRARQAVIDHLKRTVKDPADLLRVRFLSGPHLVTGINFADSREQAWQMCVIEGDARISRGSPDVEVKQYFLRNEAGMLTVRQAMNWKTYESRC